MEELHTDNINGSHEGQLWARSRARKRAYSNSKKLLTNRIRNMASLATSHAAIYSASVNDKATHYCRFELYETGESYIINIYPVINLLVTGSSL
jgi:hypothetical protein